MQIFSLVRIVLSDSLDWCKYYFPRLEWLVFLDVYIFKIYASGLFINT